MGVCVRVLDICIATSHKIKRDFKDSDFENVVQDLAKQKGRGVILFVNEDNVKKVECHLIVDVLVFQ